MSMVILRTAKLTSVGNIAGSGKHNFREREVANAQPDRSHLNRSEGAQTTEELLAAVQARLATVPTVRKNAVLAVEYFIGASPEFFTSTDRQGREAFFEDAKLWLQDRHGGENVVAFTRHYDETSPHVCAYVVPIDERGKLNARAFLGGRQLLSAMQTDFAERVGEPHGLERGIEGSQAKHVEVKDYYARVKAPTPELKTVVPPELPPPTAKEKLASFVLENTERERKVRDREAAIARRNQEAKERRLALEAKAKQYDIDKAANEARTKTVKDLRENAQLMRQIPLKDVLENFGCKPCDKDRNNYDTQVGRISIKGAKFYNHDLERGGGGAIDLVMQIEQCNYQTAVGKLTQRFGVDRVVEVVAANARTHAQNALEVVQKAPFKQPEAVPELWPKVREYLTVVRELPAEIVDRLYEAKRLFADRFANACFVLGFDPKTGTAKGIEQRGTREGSTYHGVRGQKNTFVLHEKEGTREQRVAVTESAIDAISLRALGFEGQIRATGGATSMKALGESIKARGRQVIGAFDADKAGAKFAQELGAPRLRPIHGKDWNDEWKKARLTPGAAPMDVDQRLKQEVQRQRQRGLELERGGFER
jgi:5S rRNA maturation endonuclease (ribonuclease M5)